MTMMPIRSNQIAYYNLPAAVGIILITNVALLRLLTRSADSDQVSAPTLVRTCSRMRVADIMARDMQMD